MNFKLDFIYVSLPSVIAWNTIFLIPFSFNKGINFKTYPKWEWTPPSDVNPIRWRVDLFFLVVSKRLLNSSFSKILLVKISSLITVIFCFIFLPKPITSWHTSLLPNWPSGKPMYSPDASKSALGYLSNNELK